MALKDHLLFWSVAVGVFLLDRVTKLLVFAYIPAGSSLSLLPFLSLTNIMNAGTAFGMLKSASVFFMLFAIAVSIYVLFIYRRQDTFMKVVLALVLAGAVGNLVDRLMYGAVIDFIHVGFWPVFNVADSSVTIAIALLLFRGAFYKGHRKL